MRVKDGAALAQRTAFENDADDIYFRAMAELFKGSPDPIRLIK